MKIVQSFAKFDDGNPRLSGLTKPLKSEQKEKLEKEMLLFYSFLLSYLTLNKYYGEVRMYCNKSAKDFFIKYIPYDEVKILENKNDYRFWSHYKVDVINTMRTDFIHVDSDVFIFDDLFRTFINDGSYDNLVQNIIPEGYNYVKDYVERFRDYVINNDIIDPQMYDMRCHSCGVIGMRHTHKNGYVDVADKMKKGFIDNNVTDYGFIGMAVEELGMYLYSIKNGLKTYSVIPYEDVIKYGNENRAANHHNYTHLYLNSKFELKWVKLVRAKTLNIFPDAIKCIEKYEKEMMRDSKYLQDII